MRYNTITDLIDAGKIKLDVVFDAEALMLVDDDEFYRYFNLKAEEHLSHNFRNSWNRALQNKKNIEGIFALSNAIKIVAQNITRQKSYNIDVENLMDLYSFIVVYMSYYFDLKILEVAFKEDNYMRVFLTSETTQYLFDNKYISDDMYDGLIKLKLKQP